MQERSKSYFVADVHLGLAVGDPDTREQRFIHFLKNLPKDTASLYLLGDIWDFWYEYRDVVPKYGARVVAELIQLMDRGVQVHFCEGNHDIWTFSFFESLGMKKFRQPCFTEIGGKKFCLGHGDGIGGAKLGYSLMLKLFHCRPAQKLFNTLHPWLAYRLGFGWSNSNRRKHAPYHFRNEEEPLYKFALATLEKREVDYFVFGHFHDKVDLPLGKGSRLLVLKDWMDSEEHYAVFDGQKIISF